MLNRPERPYRGWRPLGLNDLHYISDKVWFTPSRIPSGPDSDWIMLEHPTVREIKRQNRVFTPPRKRRGFADYHPCNPHITSKTFITKPREWATTPCEEGNDYSRPSKVNKVKFADHLLPGYHPVVTDCQEFEPWYARTWPK